jgi:hypothetical protein
VSTKFHAEIGISNPRCTGVPGAPRCVKLLRYCNRRFDSSLEVVSVSRMNVNEFASGCIRLKDIDACQQAHTMQCSSRQRSADMTQNDTTDKPGALQLSCCLAIMVPAHGALTTVQAISFVSPPNTGSSRREVYALYGCNDFQGYSADIV